MVLRGKPKKRFTESTRTGKQAVGHLQVYSIQTEDGVKWFKSRLEALRICDELNLEEVTVYTVKNDKPAYIFLNMLNGNYLEEKIPMKRKQSYNRSKWSYQRELLIKKMGTLGYDVSNMGIEELKKLYEERVLNEN
jgi:hypothetical protein